MITIVSVTAMPYAAASRLEEPKPITSPIVQSISSQFMPGT